MPQQILVNIDVDDLQGATAFYRAAFGLDLGRRLGDDVVELTGGSSPIYLLRRAAGTGATPAGAPSGDIRRYTRHWTPVHLDFVVDDLDEALARALRAGATLEQPASTSAWGRLALLSDPFGHGVCLVQFLGRGYDELSG
ncbi:MAG: VOC family protein [Burkholderiaceae bacterium]|nr:VOC family protein [Burkholderiaceae bacterium]